MYDAPTSYLGVLMLPDSNDDPTVRFQFAVGVSITLSIRFDLLSPERRILLRPGPMDRTSMPEASINEDR